MITPSVKIFLENKNIDTNNYKIKNIISNTVLHNFYQRLMPRMLDCDLRNRQQPDLMLLYDGTKTIRTNSNSKNTK